MYANWGMRANIDRQMDGRGSSGSHSCYRIVQIKCEGYTDDVESQTDNTRTLLIAMTEKTRVMDEINVKKRIESWSKKMVQ